MSSVVRWVCGWLCWVWLGMSFAAEPLAVDSPAFVGGNVAPAMQYLRDDDGTLTWEQVQAMPDAAWQDVTTDVPTFGYVFSPYWYRFSIRNQWETAFDGVIEISYPILDDIQIYTPGGIRGAFPLQLGDQVPFSQRPLDHHNFAVPVALGAGEERHFLMRVLTESSHQVPIHFWEREAFYQSRQNVLVGQGTYFGMLGVMVIYNLFIYISVRHASYVYYAFSVVGMGLFMGSLHGFTFKYLWPDLPSVNAWGLVAALGTFGTFACAFTISFLQLKKNQTTLYRIMMGHVFAYGLVFMAPFIFPYKVSILFAILVGFSACVCAFGAGVYMLLHGYREARYYVLAYSSLLLACIMMSMNKLGVIPRNFFTENAMQITYMMEVVLLSFALADRINVERRQKYEAQQRALENEKLARSERERYLEIEFKSQVEDLKAQQKLIEAEAESRAKGEFLATMSHEIRTPMNGVLGMAELLADTPLSKQQQQYLSVINSSGKALLNIINDVLDYSKIAAGKMDLESIDIDLEQLCMDCASVFLVSAERKSIEFLVDIDHRVPARIKGDPTRLRQVLLNLLANAFKFTQQGSVQLQVTATPREIVMTVTDTGVGIADEMRENLFSPFVQADSTTTRQFGGTGLGLTISQRLVELMGGAIRVESQQGEGSQFRVAIPLVQADEQGDRDAEPRLELLRRSVVMFVGGSVLFRQMMERQAAMVGVDIRFAASQADAVEVCGLLPKGGSQPVVLVVNQVLADGSGVDLLTRLAQGDCYHASKKVLISSIRAVPPMATLAELGVSQVLQRPVMAKQVWDAACEALSGQVAIATSDNTAARVLATPRRVLVAEDNHVNQMVVTKMLAKLGVECDVAENGREALDMLTQDHELYDAVFMDCEMPLMDGYEATRRLRQQESASQRERKPVIALTAHVLAEHKQRAEEAGMDGFLCKPVAYAALQATLVDLWGEDGAFQPAAASKLAG